MHDMTQCGPGAKPRIGGPHSVRNLSARIAESLIRGSDEHIVVDDWSRWSGRDLHQAVMAAARWLRDTAGNDELRVMACTPNCVEAVIGCLATLAAGGIWSSVNPQYAAPEKQSLIEQFDPTLLLWDESVEAPVAARLMTFRPGDRHSAFFRAIASAPNDLELPEIDPYAAALVGFTSGTSGRPRGVMHSQHSVLLAIEGSQDLGKPTGPLGVVLSIMVLNIMLLGPLHAILSGRRAVLASETSGEYLARWCPAEGITEIGVPPTIIFDLLARPEVLADPSVLPTWIETGGAACTADLQNRFTEITGRRIHRAYGLTEAPGTVALGRADASDPLDSSGYPLPHVRVSIVDQSGTELPAGHEGEICLSAVRDGPWTGLYRAMLGYWNEDDREPSVRAGVLRTGDLGSLDDLGQLHITGRRSAMIIRGGANISPAEVEEVLIGHPAVNDAAVFGVPDPRLGESVAAAIVLAPGASEPTIDEVREYATSHLARFKAPKHLVVLPSIPRNPTGKAAHHALLAAFHAQLGPSTASPTSG